MRIFKKTLFLLVVGVVASLGLYSCSFLYGTCGDVENINTQLTSVSKTQHIDSNGALIERFLPTSSNRYGGFRIYFNTNRVAQNQFPQNSFSMFSSAYALSCEEPEIYLKKSYPVSVKIFTINDLDENVKAGDLVNEYFVMPFQTIDTENTQFDENDVQNTRFDTYTYEPDFYLDFKVRPNSINYLGSVQFRVEIKTNTLRTWTETTFMIELR